jgi:hypothetical protein
MRRENAEMLKAACCEAERMLANLSGKLIGDLKDGSIPSRAGLGKRSC